MEIAWRREWENLKAEIAQLLTKIEQLEKENGELRAQLNYYKKQATRDNSVGK